MRKPRTRTVVVAGALLLAAGIAIPVAASRYDNARHATTAVEGTNVPHVTALANQCISRTVPGSDATPSSEGQNLATSVMPPETAKQVMNDQCLTAVEVNTLPDGTSNVLYRSPDYRSIVHVQISRQTDADIRADFKYTADQYAANKNQRFYKDASAKYWPTGPTHAMPSATYAYTLHTAKYGHDIIFANDGTFSVRIRVQTGAGHEKMFALAEAALKNSKQHR